MDNVKGSYCRTLPRIVLIHWSNVPDRNFKLRSSACSGVPAAPQQEMSKMSASPCYLFSSGGECVSISTGMRQQKDSGPNSCDLDCKSELAFRQSCTVWIEWCFSHIYPGTAELKTDPCGTWKLALELLLADRCVSRLTYAWQTERWGKGWSSPRSTHCQVEMNSAHQAEYSYVSVLKRGWRTLFCHMTACNRGKSDHLMLQLADADAGSQAWARVFTGKKALMFKWAQWQKPCEGNSLDIIKKTPAAKLKLQRRRSYLMADVLLVELPINNVNKVSPQLEIKDESNNVPAFSNLLNLTQRRIWIKSGRGTKDRDHFQRKNALRKRINSMDSLTVLNWMF